MSGFPQLPTLAALEAILNGTFVATFTPEANGAVGDGVADDTTAVQAAVTAASAAPTTARREVYLGATYAVGRITCSGSNIRFHGPGKLLQKAVNANVLDLTNSTDCVVEGLRIQGAGGTVLASNNLGIFAQGATRLRVIRNRFSQLAQDGVFLANCTDSEVRGNRVFSCVGGMTFVQNAVLDVCDNVVRDPVGTSVFSHAIKFDSDSGIPSLTGYNSDVVCTGNKVVNYVNAQGIMAHRLADSVIAHNIVENCLNGIGLIRSSSGGVNDIVQNVVVANNTITLTSTNSGAWAASVANAGIQVGGGSGFSTSHVSLIGNHIYNANAVQQNTADGGINLGYADHMVVQANIVSGSYCNGIVVNGPCLGLDITGNTIDGVVNANLAQVGIEQTSSSGGSTGTIGRNIIDGGAGLTDGVRSDSPTQNVVVREQTFLGTITVGYANVNHMGLLIKPLLTGGTFGTAGGANPPVSGNTYQNKTGRNVRIEFPCYATTPGTAGTITVGIDNVTPTVATMALRGVDDASTAALPTLVDFIVPPGCYWSLTASGVTIAAGVAMSL